MNNFEISNSLREELQCLLELAEVKPSQTYTIFPIVMNGFNLKELNEWKKGNYKINIQNFIGASPINIMKFGIEYPNIQHLIKVYIGCDKVYPKTMKWVGWFKKI